VKLTLTISPTTTFATVTPKGAFHCRLWKGTSSRGTEFHLLVAGVMVPEDQVVDEEVKELIELFPHEAPEITGEMDRVDKPSPPTNPSQRGGMHGHRN
jgi:hypothetical protein